MGLGAVLVQERNGERRAVCYASRTLSNVERTDTARPRGSIGLSLGL